MEFDPVVNENLTFLGIKNQKNRFVNVAPHEFFHLEGDQWIKYWSDFEKKQSFSTEFHDKSDKPNG